MNSRSTLKPNADADSRRILDAIRRIVQELRIASRRAEAELGLTGAQLFVLQKLAGSEPLSLNELAGRTLTHQSSVSVVVQRLVDRKLVRRTRGRRDGRRIELTLTAAGAHVLKDAPGAAQDRLIAAIGKFPSKSRNELALLLARLVAEMGVGGQAGMFFEK